jgi:hypothetical protein
VDAGYHSVGALQEALHKLCGIEVLVKLDQPRSHLHCEINTLRHLSLSQSAYEFELRTLLNNAPVPSRCQLLCGRRISVHPGASASCPHLRRGLLQARRQAKGSFSGLRAHLWLHVPRAGPCYSRLRLYTSMHCRLATTIRVGFGLCLHSTTKAPTSLLAS